MLKHDEKLVLSRLNAYFPRSGFQFQKHVSTVDRICEPTVHLLFVAVLNMGLGFVCSNWISAFVWYSDIVIRATDATPFAVWLFF